jgi:hypothetical protein
MHSALGVGAFIAEQPLRVPPAGVVSKISGNQIVRTPASANIDPGRGGTYPITVGIERVQKTRFIWAGTWLNPRQCVFVYKK